METVPRYLFIMYSLNKKRFELLIQCINQSIKLKLMTKNSDNKKWCLTNLSCTSLLALLKKNMMLTFKLFCNCINYIFYIINLEFFIYNFNYCCIWVFCFCLQTLYNGISHYSVGKVVWQSHIVSYKGLLLTYTYNKTKNF